MIWFCAEEKKSRFPFALNEMPNKYGRLATDFVRHFFNFDTQEIILFAKCSAANRLLNPAPGRNYGQKADF